MGSAPVFYTKLNVGIMTSQIQGPVGSSSTHILLKDISNLKANCLGFFGSKVYNLYVFVRKGEDEFFYLFVYKDPLRMKAAYEQLSASLAADAADDHVVHFSPKLAVEEA